MSSGRGSPAVGPTLQPTWRTELQARLVGGLRMTAARYPADRGVARLVAELAAQSPLFTRLWETAAADPAPDPARHKVIAHPLVGDIALDCDTLVVAADDLRLMVYTAEPGTADADRLALAIVLGTQSLIG
ncbi:hypothetical protein [Herbiconiux sp.]|uniref:MmyB family transcriptional regulator n=1 Tax=Herbiconiux sp. TaxID=1871186 RepID=UPI0025BCF483|nr:hypothetical protein [Herbiconiux sp.]